MIGELREKIPDEIVWNILKFTRHPLAELIDKCFKQWYYDFCYCCEKIINMHKDESAFLFHSIITICGNCYENDVNGIVSAYTRDYGEDSRIDFNIMWGFRDRNRKKYIDSDSDSDNEN